MEEIIATDKNNKIARKTLEQMIEKEEKIKRLRKKKSVKQIRSNTRKFGRLLQKKKSANDLKYFKKYLTHEQQANVLKELGELNKIMLVDKPYRLTLLESKIPQQYKAIALKRIQNLRYMDTCSGEYFKVKNWVDTFMTIPFGVHKTLPITMDVGVEQCHNFMEMAKDVLDSAVYGLNDAKMQIMQMVGQWFSNPSALGSAIAIKGPPGTGKTTLVKEGISKILGRDFAFIALGGATDSSFLEGHSYTYEGSTWGKIVEILIRCKSMNPVIFFDELDKLSETPKGEEITGILTHLTDTSQNSQFHDKYFSEIAFDLSKCLFIFSYNDESKVNPILLDRMYRIHTNGYGKKDKTHIAQKYLIPKIQSEVAFKPDQIIIPDETIEYIVEHHTNKEDGVRNLKRCLEIIFTKLNLYRLMKPGSKLFDKDSSSIEVAFPFTVTNSVVDKMIKKAETNSPPMFMYT
jgi:ATP-dependent Lon protease